MDVGKNCNYYIDEKHIHPTSIWEASLYKAWTDIISSMIKEYDSLKDCVKQLGQSCEAEEIILFDKVAFLAIAYYSSSDTNYDEER